MPAFLLRGTPDTAAALLPLRKRRHSCQMFVPLPLSPHCLVSQYPKDSPISALLYNDFFINYGQAGVLAEIARRCGGKLLFYEGLVVHYEGLVVHKNRRTGLSTSPSRRLHSQRGRRGFRRNRKNFRLCARRVIPPPQGKRRGLDTISETCYGMNVFRGRLAQLVRVQA